MRLKIPYGKILRSTGGRVFVPYRGKEIKNEKIGRAKKLHIVFVPYRGKEIKNHQRVYVSNAYLGFRPLLGKRD